MLILTRRRTIPLVTPNFAFNLFFFVFKPGIFTAAWIKNSDFIRCVAEPPSAPRGPVSVLSRTPDSAEIRWSAPEDTGGSPLQGYVIGIHPSDKL